MLGPSGHPMEEEIENEKEWTVEISGCMTVFDETKEGAEDWVFRNIDALSKYKNPSKNKR